MNFENWLDELIENDSRATASRKAAYAPSTISRQLSRGYLRPETIITLCRAYDRSPITGLIETGYLHNHEIHTPNTEAALRKSTNEQLLDEIKRRFNPHTHHLLDNATHDSPNEQQEHGKQGETPID